MTISGRSRIAASGAAVVELAASMVTPGLSSGAKGPSAKRILFIFGPRRSVKLIHHRQIGMRLYSYGPVIQQARDLWPWQAPGKDFPSRPGKKLASTSSFFRPVGKRLAGLLRNGIDGIRCLLFLRRPGIDSAGPRLLAASVRACQNPAIACRRTHRCRKNNPAGKPRALGCGKMWPIVKIPEIRRPDAPSAGRQ